MFFRFANSKILSKANFRIKLFLKLVIAQIEAHKIKLYNKRYPIVSLKKFL